MTSKLLLLAGAAVMLPAAARAQAADGQAASAPAARTADPAAAPPSQTDAAPAQANSAPSGSATITITAERLNAARASIQPSLGATSYTVNNATIQALPGGDNQQFNQIILQLPGVVQDGFGQFHVRDDHANLQYRINGTILPEGLAVFGQTLSPRLIEQFNLVTGALPAQYGLRTAGIIDITTKTGFTNEGEVSLYGGSHGWIEPSFEYGGSSGSTNYFVSGDFRHDRLGIESVDGSSTPLHDKTDQAQAFAYVDHILSPSDRVSFVGGYSNQAFQIPDPEGLHPDNGYNVGGTTDYLSNDLDERQVERTAFGQAAWLHHAGDVTVQTSLFARYSALLYRPDVTGELLFNGEAQAAVKHDLTIGGQVDAAWTVSPSHTLRGGLLLERDRGTSSTVTQVFPVDADGNQTGQPITISEAGGQTEWTESAYLQDEWKLSPALTFNYGLRFDAYDGYRAEHQLSPRANLVWQPAKGTTLHAGYARYFSPAPFELVGTQSIALYAGTSGAAAQSLDTTPFAEKQNYLDVGVEQKLGSSGITVGVDGYDRWSRTLVDEGQFGAPIILTPFNYARGRITGIEGDINYARGPWLAYANFSVAKATGRDIVSSQFSFDPDDLAYIRDHYIHLDHDQTYTGSAGVSYAFRSGALDGLKLGSDLIYGSGLRRDGDVPNGDHLPGYVQVNLSTSYRLAGPGMTLRLDVINAFDRKYEIRDGSGIGVGAPQYGPRRGVFVGVSKSI